jgi:hypothetical protein
VQAVGLQDALDMADRVVEPDVLAVPPVDGHQDLLEQRRQPRPGGAAPLQQVLLGGPGLAQALLDLGLVELGLGLGEPP